jgi:hypothetical protein
MDFETHLTPRSHNLPDVDVDLCALGYLLLRPLPRTSFFSSDLPDLLVSASPCLCPQFPGDYALDWCTMPNERRAETFGAVGIEPDRMPAAREWALTAFDEEFGWPAVFYSVDAARKARASFFRADLDIRVVGLAVESGALDEFLRETAPPAAVEGFAPEGAGGYHRVAQKRSRLDEGGRLLGFEPLSIEHRQVTHSWLCSQLDVHCTRVLGIRPNAAGAIATLDDARRCCDEISRAEVGAEPGLWRPFAIVDYS